MYGEDKAVSREKIHTTSVPSLHSGLNTHMHTDMHTCRYDVKGCLA